MKKYKNPWRTRTERPVYNNPWIEVTEYQVRTPADTQGIYGVVHFKNIAIGVVPIDEQGYTWLVGQYRYTLNAYSWEIPEGGCLIGKELPLQAAQRELLEETGLMASHWTPLLKTHTSNSVTDEVGYAFIAQGLTQGQAEPEETEELALWRLPFDEALQMVLRNEITDGLSALALMRAKWWLDTTK